MPYDAENVSASSTLADVCERLQAASLPAARKRDLLSAVRRVTLALQSDPRSLPADVAVLRERLAKVEPVALGDTAKTRANVRSNLVAAVKVGAPSACAPPRRLQGHSVAWKELLADEPRQARYGLSRLATWCTRQGHGPEAVDAEIFNRFEAAARADSLAHGIDARLHEMRAIWNALTVRRGSPLNAVPLVRPNKPRRIAWGDLPESFRADTEAHLKWAAGVDPFAADVRPRPLAPKSVNLRRQQIHSAADALAASGWEPARIDSLAALTSPDAFRCALGHRFGAAGKQANAYNDALAKALVAIAREWVHPSPEALAELRRLKTRLPGHRSGLTDKNKKLLRHFDHPAHLDRLIDLPRALWQGAMRQTNLQRRLQDAQTSLAIAILIYAPFRIANLAALSFGKNLFLPVGKKGETLIQLDAAIMKTREPFSLVLPPSVTKMLIAYESIARAYWRGPDRPLFVNLDGSGKLPSSVARRIENALWRGLGVNMTSHQFRHLAAKILLDADPGAYETLRQLLGHKNLKTTLSYYAELDTRRVSRIHAEMIERCAARAAANRRGKR